MTQTMTDAVLELRAAMSGPVLTPTDDAYDEARSLWNADVDRRPALIAMCRSSADVAAAIGVARRHGLELAVRGGGHSLAGYSACDGGLMIHLGEMREVRVDPQARRAVVQGGATLGELDAATQAHGLATTGGTVSHTGVAGLTLGGGFGWLVRTCGLSIDNLVGVEIVTADGRILRADATNHPDLFWAVRGGGGNFGVVTSFEFTLHEVGPLVQVGMAFWGLADGAAALRLAEDLIPTLPRDVVVMVAAVNAPPAPFVPSEHHGRPGYAFLVAGFGDPATHAEAMRRIRETLPPLFETATPMPYVALQQFLDAGNPWGVHAYEKGCYLPALTEDVIEAITARVEQKRSPMTQLIVVRLDGAYSDVPDADTAFGGSRQPQYLVVIVGLAPTADGLPAERDWVRATWQALQPHASGAGYVNTREDLSSAEVPEIYREKYDRLARIKASYDPANLFHRNANILPRP